MQGLLLVFLVVFGIRYYRESSQNLTEQYRQQLAGTSATARLSAESFFRKYSENLRLLARDPGLRVLISGEEDTADAPFCLMENLFSIHRTEVDALILMDTTSLVIKRIGNDTIEPDHMMCIGNTMANPVVPPDSVYYSDIFVNHKNQKAITLSCPVYENGQRVAIVRWMVTIESINRHLMQALEEDELTHFVVFDEEGRLLSSDEDYYGWLCGVAGCDCSGDWYRRPVIRSFGRLKMTGSGTLELAPPGCRVYGAWSELTVGSRSWRIMVMMPVVELESVMSRHRATTMAMTGVVLAISISMLFVVLNMRNKRSKLETEARYLERLARTQTQLKEEREQRLSAQITGQELERQRLSRELHDGLGQMLLALKLRIQGEAPQSDVASSEPIALLEQTITEAKRISEGLSPAVLHELGVLEAIEKYCNSSSQHTGITIDFVHYGLDGNINKEISTHLYRIVQEGVSNAIRHSHASEINIQLLAGQIRITLLIQDNGKGFNPEARDHKKGTGLDNMRDRATILNGTFDLTSTPQEGTTIVIKIPYSSPQT